MSQLPYSDMTEVKRREREQVEETAVLRVATFIVDALLFAADKERLCSF